MNKNKISATIIADSKNEFGQRLITYVLVFPRIILAELNTHRMFSRNSASSRAIPFKKMLERVQNDPFIPIAWQKDHSGMQGTEYETNQRHIARKENIWLKAANDASFAALELSRDDVTKQICNRLLEPFLWHTAIVTATEYENFFALRCPQYHSPVDRFFRHRSKKDCIAAHSHPDNIDSFNKMNTVEWLQMNEGQGEIHIMALAEAMWDARNESTPKELKAGEWHIPFGDQIDEQRIYDLFSNSGAFVANADHHDEQWEVFLSEAKIKIATARCARVSYMNFDGSDDYEKDIALYDRLAASGHMSPFEHCAQAMDKFDYTTDSYTNNLYSPEKQGWCGNFRGFIQMRKMIPNENRTV